MSINKEQILACLPLGPLELDHLDARDRLQLVTYLNDMFTSLVMRLEYINAHGSGEGYIGKAYKAPSGKATKDEEALWIFEGLKNAGLLMTGREAELATGIVRSLKSFKLID